MWIGRRRERMPNIRMGVCKSMGMEELGIGLRGCWAEEWFFTRQVYHS
jgi:hypothetical protein